MYIFFRAFTLILLTLTLLSCQKNKSFDQGFSPREKTTETERKNASNRSVTWNRRQEEIEADKRHLQIKLDAGDARHLLERSGIGAHPSEIAALTGMTRSQAISKIISEFSDTTSLPLPSFINSTLAPYWIRYDFDENKREAFRMSRDREMSEYRLWWIREMIQTPSPQTERMVLFWHNHFVSAYSSIQQQSIAIARQNMMFRSLGMTNFRTLTKNIIRDPAMLNYLDNDRNEKEKPNENLGRELMELFTLGEGNYDEKTVKEAARALTGYSVNLLKDFSFELRKWRQDVGIKNLFGRTGNFNGDNLVDIILEQPATAEFITRKFWRKFVSETFSKKAEISAIADKFRASDYDLKTLYRAIFTTPSFWDPRIRGTIVKSPVDMIIGTVRSTGFLPADWTSIPSKLEKLGQHLFEPPNVAGWPGGSRWITPSGLLSRRDAMMRFFNTQGDGVRSMMQMSGSGVMGQENKITVRYGAENFQGPPKFLVKLYKEKGARKIVWRSDILTAIGGHDTELNGRIKGDASIPWQTMILDFDYQGKFKEVAVEFINDHCCGPGGSQGGDRNFFVDWVRMGDKVYLASKGHQRSNCPPKKSSRSGRLNCRGDVIMSEPISLSTNVKPKNPKNHLVVEHVALDWLNKFDPDKNWQDFSISLLNPSFNKIRLQGMKAQFVRRGDGDIHLTIDSRHCHPDCLEDNWPNSAQLKKNRSTRLINISLTGEYRRRHEMHYQELTIEQTAFVNAIWASFPQLLQEIKKGRRWRRNGNKRYPGWKETIDYILRTLPETRHVKNSVEKPLIVLPTASRQGMMMMMASAQTKPPNPAGKQPIVTSSQWNILANPILKSSKPSQVLLALAPVVASPDERAISKLINDPVFNLK
ncbi:MAG TPA: DUF1800 family protein [Rhodospirillales bacterium]|nr:DUF1800 family protein [Rhodospirillales bacterium]